MAKDFRSLIIEFVEEGRLTWEAVAMEFIQFCSQDDNEEVLSALTDGEY